MTEKEAIEILRTAVGCCSNDTEYIALEKLISALPKHGKWIFKNRWITCSVCEGQPYKDFRSIDFDNLFKYCPYCGAKMYGKENEK